jgi:hypothetical protein
MEGGRPQGCQQVCNIVSKAGNATYVGVHLWQVGELCMRTIIDLAN